MSEPSVAAMMCLYMAFLLGVRHGALYCLGPGRAH
jgi:hypothetical protein